MPTGFQRDLTYRLIATMYYDGSHYITVGCSSQAAVMSASTWVWRDGMHPGAVGMCPTLHVPHPPARSWESAAWRGMQRVRAQRAAVLSLGHLRGGCVGAKSVPLTNRSIL